MGNKQTSQGAHSKHAEKLPGTVAALETERRQRVLVVGSGAREHAIVWKLAQSQVISHIFIAPANGALGVLSAQQAAASDNCESQGPVIQNTPFTTIDTGEILKLVDYCVENQISLVVVGPELPLAQGITDCLESKKIKCFGPKQAAAEIESSKAFSKLFMTENQIPTPEYRIFRDGEYMEAVQYVNECESNQHHVVVKASGLCGGKGVYVCSSHEEARNALRILFLEQPYGDQSLPVIIEQRLEGREVSVMAFCDGSSYALMPCAHDYKRRFNGDCGPNTGGMGVVAPLPPSYISERDIEHIRVHVFDKTIDGLARQNRTFVGVLYAGIMLTRDGPKVLEYNCRFGDPEAEAVLPLLVTDLYDIMKWCVDGYLDANQQNIVWREGTYAVGITVCSRDYPERRLAAPAARITGLDACHELVFLGNTQASPASVGKNSSSSSSLFTTGGRVACCVSVSTNPLRAFAKACADAWCIGIKRDVGSEYGSQRDEADFRTDIGGDVLFECLDTSAKQSYADAGVSIDKGNAVIKNIADICRRTRIPGVNSDTFGLFGALFEWNKYVNDVDPLFNGDSLTDASQANGEKVVVPAVAAAGGGDERQLMQPVFVSGCDGVGSKILLAQRLGRLSQVGIDLVAMCVNDVLCHGAAPLIFLDYYACGKLNNAGMVQVVEGIGAGCQLAGCALVGGETAELPGLYTGSKFDLAGFTVGVVDARSALPRLSAMHAGDILLGLASSGIHSNGFSLIRKILDGTTTAAVGDEIDDVSAPQIDAVYQRLIRPAGFAAALLNYDNVTKSTAVDSNNRIEIGAGDAANIHIKNNNLASVVPPPSLADILLTPTRIYTRSILPLLRSQEHGAHIKAIAHITGGGLNDNVPRVLPAHLEAHIDAMKWSIPPIFGWIAKHGPVSSQEMLRTFNLGIGMVLVVDRSADIGQIINLLEICGETAYIIGSVADSRARKLSTASTSSSNGRSGKLNEEESDAGPEIIQAPRSRVQISNLNKALLRCIAQASRGDAQHVATTLKLEMEHATQQLSTATTDAASSHQSGATAQRRGILRKPSGDNGITKANGVHFKDITDEVDDNVVETIVLERMLDKTISSDFVDVYDDAQVAESNRNIENGVKLVDAEENDNSLVVAAVEKTFTSTVVTTTADPVKHMNAEKQECDGKTKTIEIAPQNNTTQSDIAGSETCNNNNIKNEPARIAVLISGTGSNLQALLDYAQRLEYDQTSVWRCASGAVDYELLQPNNVDHNNVGGELVNGLGESNADSHADICDSTEYKLPRWRPWQVVLVISNKKSARGLTRAQQEGPTAIKAVVIEHSKYATREAFDEAISSDLRRERIDFIVLAGFMRILSARFCEEWCGRLINIHPSLLPSFRGANAQEQAHAARVRVAGCTVHFVEPNVDAGPIVLQAAVTAYPGRDTVDDLRARILEREHVILPRALDLLVSGYVRYAKNISFDAVDNNSNNNNNKEADQKKLQAQRSTSLVNGGGVDGVDHDDGSSSVKHRHGYRHSVANLGGTLTRRVAGTFLLSSSHSMRKLSAPSSTAMSNKDVVEIGEEAGRVGHHADNSLTDIKKRACSKNPTPASAAAPLSRGVCEWHPAALRLNVDNASSSTSHQ